LAAHDPVLRVQGLAARYGKIVALRNASLEIGEGEAVALLGANGSGKTTLLNTLCGFLPPTAGTMSLAGEAIGGLPPHRVFQRGIVQVSQARDLFGSMTVLDNLLLGAVRRNRPGPAVTDIFGYFPRLQERQLQVVRTLSGGEQQMVAMGRALMARPRLLCMDEPSMGLAPIFVEQVFDIIQEINRQGTTIFMVEQNANMALSIANRAYVLQTGAVVLSGAADELRRNPLIREAYLGELQVTAAA